MHSFEVVAVQYLFWHPSASLLEMWVMEPKSIWDYACPKAGSLRILSFIFYPSRFINSLSSKTRLPHLLSVLTDFHSLCNPGVFPLCVMFNFLPLALKHTLLPFNLVCVEIPEQTPRPLKWFSGRDCTRYCGWMLFESKGDVIPALRSLRGTPADPMNPPRYHQGESTHILGRLANDFGLGLCNAKNMSHSVTGMADSEHALLPWEHEHVFISKQKEFTFTALVCGCFPHHSLGTSVLPKAVVCSSHPSITPHAHIRPCCLQVGCPGPMLMQVTPSWLCRCSQHPFILWCIMWHFSDLVMK